MNFNFPWKGNKPNTDENVKIKVNSNTRLTVSKYLVSDNTK